MAGAKAAAANVDANAKARSIKVKAVTTLQPRATAHSLVMAVMGRRVALEMQVDPSSSTSLSPDGGEQELEEESTGSSYGPRRELQTGWESAALSRRSDATRPPPRSPTTTGLVVRYFAASTLAVALTVACPGKTDLWHAHSLTTTDGAQTSMPNYDTLQWGILIEILLSLAATQILFIRVVKSDPGYLDPELMIQMNARSGIAAKDEDPGSVSFPAPSVDSIKEMRSLLPASHVPTRGEGEASDGMVARLDYQLPSGQLSSPHSPQRRPYCSTCGLAPPLRAHHCRACQKCVATFDHHCPLTGNCVGERNRALFVAFLIAQVVGIVLCVRVVNSSRIGLTTLMFGGVVDVNDNETHQSGPNSGIGGRSNWTGRQAALQAMQVLVTELYVVPIALTAFVMAMAHVVMVACNTTTFEFAKSHHLEYMQSYDITDCPFSAGAVANVRRAVHLGWHDPWLPYEWSLPSTNPSNGSADWWNHLWRNKYWSCC